MTKTIVTLQKTSGDEYNLAATFSDGTLKALSAVQSQLYDLLGDAIWLTPQRALHSTLMEIICDVAYAAPRNQLFDAWYEKYNHVVAAILQNVAPFEITFSQLEISPRAIIVKSADSKIFNDIRSALLSRIELPEQTKSPPDIIHSSLARFNSVLDVEDIVDQTRGIRLGITEHISGFKLLKGLGPPAFDRAIIQEYTLQK